GFVLFVLTGCGFFGPGYQYKGSVLEPSQTIDVALTQTDGTSLNIGNLPDDITLVYFGYTFCPDFCPLTLHKAAQAVSRLDNGQDRVNIVFVSVDPERDTPQIIDGYLAGFEAMSGANLIGLSGTWPELENAMKPFGAFAAKEDASGSAANYLVSHTTRLYVINQQGEWMVHYPFEAKTEDIQQDLAFLVSQLN
ncbi:MAG: SCO family protein, partial [Chloroflexota bacterium]